MDSARGARGAFNSKFSLQGSLGFVGTYKFKNQTEAARQGTLNRPFAIRLKPEFFPVDHLALSIDLDLRYVSWRTFRLGGTDIQISTSEFSVGVGVSYHFGSGAASDAARPAAIQPALKPTPDPERIPTDGSAT